MDRDLDLSNNAEINKVLKEFEMKSSANQTQDAPRVPEVSDMPRMVKLVIKLSGGAIKEQRQAEYVLLGFVVVVIIISVFIFLGGSRIFENDLNAEQGEEIIPGQIPGEI